MGRKRFRTLFLTVTTTVALYGAIKFVRSHVEWRKERAAKRSSDEFYRSRTWN